MSMGYHHNHTHLWTEDERRGLMAARRFLTLLANLDPYLDRWPMLLLEIALQDPIKPLTLTDMADRCEFPQPSMSRVLATLGGGDDKRRAGPKGGLKLVEKRSHPENYKALTAVLTVAGVNALRNFVRALER